MSDSRLEKFIYAICSMDVTDLPVPLSRIEKLWNCLITGETPDFEPLSRNEKYLMAMLDRYDISNLPAPMSRGEKLLYKIAVGETDLSDVPGYLSRYEELLKYLIENDGISGGDFEYVLYTLNQSLHTLYTTAEKPVKSAILSGQTLVNLLTKSNIKITNNGFNIIDYVYPLDNTKTYIIRYCVNQLPELSDTSDSARAFKFEWYHGGNAGGHKNIYNKYVVVGRNEYIKIEPYYDEINRNNLGIWCMNYATGTLDIDITILEYIEGMENWDIPYFDGMQSVKMPVLTTTGKNLFDKNNVMKDKYISGAGKETSEVGTNRNATDFIQVKPNTSYLLSGVQNSGVTNSNKQFYVAQYDANKEIIVVTAPSVSSDYVKITTEAKTKYIRTTIKDDDLDRCQIEQSTQATSYEPYKSNILSTPEDVTLRGVGDVKDELDLITGELTQRIGEVVLAEKESGISVFYVSEGTNITTSAFRYSLPVSEPHLNAYKQTYISNKLAYGDVYTQDRECFNIHGNTVRIRINKSKLTTDDLSGFKQWLSQNPITIQYELGTESVKTVDLTTVDQDNQPAKLGTFENVTHVSLESAGLIPTLEMEVATRISKELASASPLMDDISTKQQQLEVTVDEQSNNVDATMIATTEIFEETL